MYLQSFSDIGCSCPGILGHVAGVASLRRDQGLSCTGHGQLQHPGTAELLSQAGSSSGEKKKKKNVKKG